MGLSPAAERECGRLLPRFPRPRLRPAPRTASVRTNDTQPAPGLSPGPQSGRRGRGAPPRQAPTPGPGTFRGRSPGPSRPSDPQKEESVGSQELVQLLPKQPQQGTLEQGRSSVQQGEKPLESTPNQKRAEWNSAPEPGSAGRLIKQAAEGKPRPRPGDLIEIFRTGYEHWAVYVEDGCVVHLAPTSEEFEASGIASVFSNRAVVTYSRLEDVLHGCSWKVNNKLDGTYLPLPVDKIVQRTKKMVNKIVQYSLIEGNCEHFVNDLRYGVPRSQQVEHMLTEGAKAAGAVLSAVAGSLRPKPAMARRL
ncbi:phospholipase A and acyltransferase 5 [Balaenoptera acutorostrata]|uniref:Phospholipase A and acyltransferase 5 n=1 Tax=Balaenoptera acutorostrata TaxID=9767 RepID=A0A383ZHA2_BALAC|nr:phospholipase A and acyltransferase 5 [Balaenoptera acutorostrata]